MKIVSTQKIAPQNKSFIKRNDYYVKGKYCYYVSQIAKAKSIEAIIDTIASNGIYIFENLKDKEIAIIYINKLQNSIVFNIEKHFSWNKFNSILKTILIKESLDDVYVKENSKIANKIDTKKEIITDSQMQKAIKKSKTMMTRKRYLLRDIAVLLFLSGVFYMQNYYFQKMVEKNNAVYTKTKNSIEKEIRKIKISILKTNKLIADMPKDVAKDYTQIVHVINGKRKRK